ncbi:hypothetical protein BJX65DRAFT_288130 [Aspergillus insuetus]
MLSRPLELESRLLVFCVPQLRTVVGRVWYRCLVPQAIVCWSVLFPLGADLGTVSRIRSGWYPLPGPVCLSSWVWRRVRSECVRPPILVVGISGMYFHPHSRRRFHLVLC